MSAGHFIEKQYTEKTVVENGNIKQHSQIEKQNIDGNVTIKGNINGNPIYYETMPRYQFSHIPAREKHVSFGPIEEQYRTNRSPSITMKIVRMPTPYPKKTSRKRSLRKKRRTMKNRNSTINKRKR